MDKKNLSEMELENIFLFSAKLGNETAKKELYERHLSDINEIASKFSSIVNVDDLKQDLSIALLKAIDSYNVGTNESFICYCFPYFRNSIKLFLTNNLDNIPFSMKQEKFIQKIFVDILKTKHSEELETLEITNDLSEIKDEEDYIKELDDKNDSSKIIDKTITNEKKKKILSLRFGLNDNPLLSNNASGNVVGLSKQRINQIVKESIEKMNNYISNNV